MPVAAGEPPSGDEPERIRDHNGIWIAGKAGLYLMSAAGVFAAGEHTGVLAGGCS